MAFATSFANSEDHRLTMTILAGSAHDTYTLHKAAAAASPDDVVATR